jgi:hypothetical protein
MRAAVEVWAAAEVVPAVLPVRAVLEAWEVACVA